MSHLAALEAREARCQTVDDFVSLALEAMAEPSDAVYARSLLAAASRRR